MKKTLALLLSFVLLIGMVAGCSEPSAPADSTGGNTGDDTLSIVCTIFPEYDWVKQILGDTADDAELTMMLDNGVDLHSFQPTVDDMIQISTCDLFIYVGGQSDNWVESALKEAVNEDMIVIDLMDVLGDTVKEEELVEGMEPEAEEAEEEPEYDEHIWLSVKNAKTLCEYIAKQIQFIDADNADTYAANLEAYLAQLDTLDEAYQSMADSAEFHTLVFGDRFPFRYLADDYNLDYFAAFPGCSAETEASFETIAFLADKVDELGLDSVLTIEGPEHKIAETIIANTSAKDQGILVLDSMQAKTSEDIDSGETYISIMEHNLDLLKDALNT